MMKISRSAAAFALFGVLSPSLMAQGLIASWGYDVYGQITNTPPGTGFVQVAGGQHHSLALGADGSIASWGRDFEGQVTNTPPGTGFVQVAGGGNHSLALRADGSIASWGWDFFGQVTNTPPETGFVQVAGGGYHSLALRADGSIASWGYDAYGQVTNTPPGTGFVQVAGGYYHSLALGADCNGNGVPDDQDIADGTSTDCDGNGRPDECDIADDPSNDWNGDGIHDACSPPNYCTANPNTTGQPAVMSVSGSPLIVDNNFTLTAAQMPMNVFGYFLNSDVQGFVPFPGGSQGNLCLGGGIGRHAKQIANSGAAGELVIDVDLTALPRPNGTHSVVAGETWNFQAWFRDKVAGMPTSNFTDGIEIVFQ